MFVFHPSSGIIRSSFGKMDGLPPNVRILKSLIAPARHSDGPTLYLICSEVEHHVIYEQMPDGTCQAWADTSSKCIQQAESMIYQRVVMLD